MEVVFVARQLGLLKEIANKRAFLAEFHHFALFVNAIASDPPAVRERVKNTRIILASIQSMSPAKLRPFAEQKVTLCRENF